MLSDYFVAKNDDLNPRVGTCWRQASTFLNHAGVVEGGASYEYFGDQFAVRAHDDLRTRRRGLCVLRREVECVAIGELRLPSPDNLMTTTSSRRSTRFLPARRARVTRTGFDETVAKAAVSYSGSQDAAARESPGGKRACRSQAAALENAEGGSRNPSREHAKRAVPRSAGATEASGGGAADLDH